MAEKYEQIFRQLYERKYITNKQAQTSYQRVQEIQKKMHQQIHGSKSKKPKQIENNNNVYLQVDFLTQGKKHKPLFFQEKQKNTPFRIPTEKITQQLSRSRMRSVSSSRMKKSRLQEDSQSPVKCDPRIRELDRHNSTKSPKRTLFSRRSLSDKISPACPQQLSLSSGMEKAPRIKLRCAPSTFLSQSMSVGVRRNNVSITSQHKKQTKINALFKNRNEDANQLMPWNVPTHQSQFC